MKPDHMHDMPPVKCPACGHELNAATQVSGPAGRPEPGNITVCIQCCAALSWTHDMVYRSLSDEDMAGLDPYTLAALRKVQSLIRLSKK